MSAQVLRVAGHRLTFAASKTLLGADHTLVGWIDQQVRRARGARQVGTAPAQPPPGEEVTIFVFVLLAHTMGSEQRIEISPCGKA